MRFKDLTVEFWLPDCADDGYAEAEDLPEIYIGDEYGEHTCITANVFDLIVECIKEYLAEGFETAKIHPVYADVAVEWLRKFADDIQELNK